MDHTSQRVRVRFAPSPTGHLHIGSLRTALFNFLFARHHGGDFLVRIEDTDIVRSRAEYTDAIVDGLSWVDIFPDEPIVMQTSRIDEHKRLIAKLIDEGKAYKCYCPTRPVASESEYYKYDGACRSGKQVVPDGTPYVVRIKLPLDESAISFDDAIRDTVSIAIQELDDFVIARSDGTPVYNFVVVVDDAHMNITHVIRGEDHISNTPKQIVLYRALGFDIPQFAHLPLILGSSGQRLSKRDAATSVFEYKDEGYLPAALCNYLVRLGWSHGDQELFTRDEMIKLFTLDAVGKKGAMFDLEKLQWFNGVYMRETDSYVLWTVICADVDTTLRTELTQWSDETIVGFIDLYKDRVATLKQLAQVLRQLHAGSYTISPEDKQQWLTDAVSMLDELIALLSRTNFTVDELTTAIKGLCADQNIKLPQIAQPLRLALTGSTKSPGVFQVLALYGKDESIARIKRLRDMI